ncbi:type II toxin-antitoxin system HicA family toxin [Candidatus Synechococcus calcipolaris G9]|uniref:Type II toxin-antitoxin system HicA family toxin n=2 Tax=Synechococcus TaxID=1129 RepID=A0ABT6EV85_9SYNE|nr:type II toxin-antitoxin system HicA family toxin [Candidatus Synechococcus calcipolaris]MDG2989700.1 type II toxin-antitoxin system HicA family toxin [Candidatus Synechococcus calcipolaris G9]
MVVLLFKNKLGKRLWLCKILEQSGWVLRRVTSSHHIYESPELEQSPSVFVRCNQDFKVLTLKALTKIA